MTCAHSRAIALLPGLGARWPNLTTLFVSPALSQYQTTRREFSLWEFPKSVTAVFRPKGRLRRESAGIVGTRKGGSAHSLPSYKDGSSSNVLFGRNIHWYAFRQRHAWEFASGGLVCYLIEATADNRKYTQMEHMGCGRPRINCAARTSPYI